jgi:hypothetical protein
MAGVLAAPRSSRRHFGYTADMARSHPTQPYWYGEVVGIDPEARGFGVGTLAARAGPGSRRRCWATLHNLETMTERNVTWYRDLGFEAREAGVRFVPGGPPNWTMIRHPVRNRSALDREAGGPGGEGGTT